MQSDMAQMGQPGDDPEQAVETKGGKVNKTLGLINGFAAELSPWPSQHIRHNCTAA